MTQQNVTLPAKKHRVDARANQYRRQRGLGWMVSIGITLVVLVLLFGVWLRPHRIVGDSMSPALNDGDIVLVDRLAKYWKTPARGDMVCFSTEEGTFIKRIVGLPMETVAMDGGQVFINSCPLDEAAYATLWDEEAEQTTVPYGSVYVLGDRREKVYDSRLDSVGCISYEKMDGVLRLRIMPLSRITLFF